MIMETRRRIRVDIKLTVVSKIEYDYGQQFSLACGETFKVDAVDISTLGMGIMSEHFLPQGLTVELKIDGKVFGFNKNMFIKTEVCYCAYLEPSKYRCGMRFVDIDPEYHDLIKKFISVRERRKASRVKLSD